MTIGPPDPEPHLNLIPSVVHQDHRIRAIWNRIYPRPLRETFHEFLINVVLWTLGEDWLKHQIALAEAERHVVVRWKYAFEEYKRASMPRAEREQVGDGQETGIVPGRLLRGQLANLGAHTLPSPRRSMRRTKVSTLRLSDLL